MPLFHVLYVCMAWTQTTVPLCFITQKPRGRMKERRQEVNKEKQESTSNEIFSYSVGININCKSSWAACTNISIVFKCQITSNGSKDKKYVGICSARYLHKCGKHQQIFYFLAPVHARSYAGGNNRCSSGIVGSTPTRQQYSCTGLWSPSNRLNHRPSNLTSWLANDQEINHCTTDEGVKSWKGAERTKEVEFVCSSFHAHPFFARQTWPLHKKSVKCISCWCCRKCQLSNQVGVGPATRPWLWQGIGERDYSTLGRWTLEKFSAVYLSQHE
jgi:hypothetical protein